MSHHGNHRRLNQVRDIMGLDARDRIMTDEFLDRAIAEMKARNAAPAVHPPPTHFEGIPWITIDRWTDEMLGERKAEGE